MTDTSSIFLHAELLPNIRQLTVHASLPIPSSSIDLRASSITLSESRRAITVYTVRGTGAEKEDLLETLKLPARVTEASRRNLTFAGHQVESHGDHESTNSTEYSFRLQVDGHDTSLITVNNGLHEDDFVPWTAKDMSPHSVLHCRSCSQEILGRLQHETTSWSWKDLPSGNWAEMMDFWHCHKPDVHVDEKDQQKVTDDQNASVKGYGASNRVVALPGTVLVDVASFLVAESDCYNIKRVSYTSHVSKPSQLQYIHSLSLLFSACVFFLFHHSRLLSNRTSGQKRRRLFRSPTMKPSIQMPNMNNFSRTPVSPLAPTGRKLSILVMD